MNKRQRDCDVEMVEMTEIVDITKRVKKDTISIDEYSNDFEKKHLIYTNNEMARFVRSSVETMRRQQEEITRLKAIIENFSSSVEP